MTRPEQPQYAACGMDRRDCKVDHPAKPFVDRPLGRRLAALHPEPVEDSRPAWLRHLTAKDMTGALGR